MPARKRKSAQNSTPSESQQIEIPDDEKWRIINESGVLNRATASSQGVQETEEAESTLADDVFDTILHIIPFSFLLMLMEILIHHQYGKRASVQVILDRMVPSVPILSLFIFYTTKYKHYRKMQIFLFMLGTIVGPRTLWLVSRASWLVNMRQCPPLITLWIYTIHQMNLGLAVLNLVITGLFVWVFGLKPFR